MIAGLSPITSAKAMVAERYLTPRAEVKTVVVVQNRHF
jgi:hypothetical protein